MKLLRSSKQVIGKDKNSENVPKLESVEVVLMYYNVVKSDYQQAWKVIFTFVPNKQFGHLISIALHSFITLNTINTEFLFIDVCFTDQNSKFLKIKDSVNMIFAKGSI